MKKKTSTVTNKYSFINYKNVILFCTISIFLYSFYYYRKIKYDDTSLLGGDEWEYQAMGVNYATGHGFPVFGCAEPFEKYKMTRAWSKDYYNYYFKMFKDEKIDYRFYRTPGYPFFIGLVYKIYGVSPLKVKQIQLLMLIIIASFLPFIGYHHWKIPGFITGIVAGILFMNSNVPGDTINRKYYEITHELMTESLIMFSIFAIVIAFIWHQCKKNILTSITLGIIIGIAVLVKGSLIYVPLLFFGYFLYECIKKNEKKLNVALIIFFSTVTIGLWSNYATHKAGKTIVLSTQGDLALLYGNNELTFKSGGWNQYNPEDTTIFYNKKEMQGIPVNTQVKLFFQKYYDKIPLMIYNKIVYGFEEFFYIKLSVLLIIFELLQILIEKFYSNLLSKQKQFKWLSLIVTLVLAVVSFKIFPLLCLLAALYIIVFVKGDLNKTTVSVPAFILLLNFIALTVVIFGFPRFIYVIDFLFIQTALIYLWNSAKTVYLWVAK